MAQRYGFALLDLGIEDQGNQVGFRDNGQYVEVFRVTYTGLLRVTDQESFKLAVYNGIGHGKAFGCGLITIRS
jgi:CRISPR system Cascade subunit CasE